MNRKRANVYLPALILGQMVVVSWRTGQMVISWGRGTTSHVDYWNY
jgi:hypothetical protein